MLGLLDNIRLWWPVCADSHDPSKCNPYAFVSALKDGSRMPTARDAQGLPIHDADVTLEMVAAPVLANMLRDEILPADGAHLLLNLNFNKQNGQDKEVVNSASGGPFCAGEISLSQLPMKLTV